MAGFAGSHAANKIGRITGNSPETVNICIGSLTQTEKKCRNLLHGKSLVTIVMGLLR